MRLHTTLASLLLFVASGCVVVHDNNPPPPGPPPPTPPPQAPPTYRIQPGGATIVQPGVQAGYGITANVGGSYRAVWTGGQSFASNHFTGYIYTPGHFVSYTPGCDRGFCALEAGDYVYAPVAVQGGGEEIDFDTFASDGLDGLDFVVDTEPVTFQTEIDGTAYPGYVFFPATDAGGASTNPGSVPFALTTQ